jgi:hypothetical protein
MGIITTTKVEIGPGLAMPFKLMKASVGAPLRTSKDIKNAVKELDNDAVLVQPALGGQRVCVAIVDKNVFITDDQARWITKPPRNGHDFLKLPNNTCLEGYITRDTFYPEDCLAVRGQSLIHRTAAERSAMAYQLCKFLQQPWLFDRPSPRFVKAARKNLPDYPGLMLKDYMSFYVLISSNAEASKAWQKRLW